MTKRNKSNKNVVVTAAAVEAHEAVGIEAITHDVSGAPMHLEPSAEDVAAAEADMHTTLADRTYFDSLDAEAAAITEASTNAMPSAILDVTDELLSGPDENAPSETVEEPNEPEATDDADLSVVMAKIEADQEQAEGDQPQATGDDTTTEEGPKPLTLAEIVANITDADALAFAQDVGLELDRRERFERSLPDFKEQIVKSLANARKSLAMPSAAKIMMAASVDLDFINREIHTGARYNVYALGKLADIIHALANGRAMGNAINRACMVSLFRARANGTPFTLDIAKAASSKQIRVEPSINAWLLRHTVSPSTAPTQSSSTMQALRTLGIVRTDGSVKRPTYIVEDNAVSRAAEEICKTITAVAA